MKLRKTKAMRLIVFMKFFIWDFSIKRIEITLKELWVISGINTIMPDFRPR